VEDQENDYWKLFKLGNEEAFTLLFRKYYKALYNYGKKINNDKENLEDCIQETFLGLWQKKERLPEVLSIKAYLFKILKIKLIKIKTSGLLKIDIGEEFMPYDFSFEDFIIQEQENTELREKVISALSKLSKRQKEIIYLRFYNKMSYEEICEVMSINNQTARNLIHHSIKVLKGHLSLLMLIYLLSNSEENYIFHSIINQGPGGSHW